MAAKNIKVTILIRQDTAANWSSKNPVLKAGEWGYDTTNKIVKLGDGVTAWNDLGQIGGGGGGVAVFAASADEANKSRGYTRGGEIDKKIKEIEARLSALEQ